MRIAKTCCHGTGADQQKQRAEVLIAEDNLLLSSMLEAYLLASSEWTVRATDSPVEARRWLEEDLGPLVLDGSVFAQMGMALRELPDQVILWSGDDDLVERARQLGLKAFSKDGLASLGTLRRDLAELAGREPVAPA